MKLSTFTYPDTNQTAIPNTTIKNPDRTLVVMFGPSHYLMPQPPFNGPGCVPRSPCHWVLQLRRNFRDAYPGRHVGRCPPPIRAHNSPHSPRTGYRPRTVVRSRTIPCLPFPLIPRRNRPRTHNIPQPRATILALFSRGMQGRLSPSREPSIHGYLRNRRHSRLPRSIQTAP